MQSAGPVTRFGSKADIYIGHSNYGNIRGFQGTYLTPMISYRAESNYIPISNTSSTSWLNGFFPLFGRWRTRDRPGAADQTLSQMLLSSPDKKRMGKQAFTCSFCLCSAFDLKTAGREAVEQVCGNLSTAVCRGPREERSVRPWPVLSQHCCAGYHG